MACDQCRPYGGLWRMAANGGLERCDCDEGRRAAEIEAARAQGGQPPALDNEAALVFCEMLAGVVKYFPGSGVSRAAIASEIRSMCRNQGEAIWLVQRMGRLYAEWPGTKEMRRVYCGKHIPLDGQIDTTESLTYPDGIPSERIGTSPRLVIGAGDQRQICAAGETPTVSPEKIQRSISQMARQARQMPSGSIGTGRFEESLQESITAPQDRRELPGPTPQIITREQAEQAVRELRERKARGEAMPWDAGESGNMNEGGQE